jgi:Ca2+-binding EF-hand superfamily protein
MLKLMNSLQNGLPAMLVIYAAIGPVAAQGVPENDPVVASAPLWDLDHNGTYTCDEWEQYASRIFNLADRNRDGYVDAAEFKTIQQATPVFKEAELAYFDDNRDGRLSREEFVRKPNPLFARYDRNGDCKVTPAELKGNADAPQPSAKQRPGRGGR